MLTFLANSGNELTVVDHDQSSGPFRPTVDHSDTPSVVTLP